MSFYSNSLEQDYTATLNNLKEEYASLEGDLESIQLAGVEKVKSARLRAEADLQQKKNDNVKLALKTELERVERVSKAEQSALNEILKTRLSIEEKITELATLRTETEQKSFEQYATNQRLTEQFEKRLSLQKQINEELIKYNATADSQKGQRITKRIENDYALSQTNKRAAEYVSDIPLIGKKFGELGHISDVFKDLSRFTDDLGNSITLATSLKSRKETREKTKDTKEYRNSEEFKKSSANYTEQLKAISSIEEKIISAEAKGEKTDKLYEQLEEAENEKNKVIADSGKSEAELKQAIKDQKDEDRAQGGVSGALYAGLANTTAALANIAQKLEPLYDEIAGYKSQVDTRLYGATSEKMFGSYWSKISYDFSALIASPLVKQEALYKSVLQVVDSGIARDVEQMAMLNTIKDKIATTFNVFDSTMLRLIRIQDSNTTAARLGMEASLNEMLNQMYSTTEYLKDLASSVRSDLGEAQALMSDTEAVDFEYQVQKWLGSMYSVGVSQSGISAISGSLGKLAAGDIEGIVNGGAGNLLIMAANNANLSIADILADGLDASNTNTLLNSAVSYMSDLVDEANGNKVVQQQLAKVFGLAASDLKAIKNIINEPDELDKIYRRNENYGSLVGNLFSVAGSMYDRISVGEMITNAMANVEYSTAAGVASNPLLYITNKVANVLDSFAGGIPIPAVTALGTGVDTKLTVSNIMKSAAMVGGFTQSLISAISSAIGNKGSGFSGSGLLNLVGINGSSVKRGSSTSSSGSGDVLNASVDDMSESATQQGKDDANKQKVEAKEESTDITNEDINNNIVNIYELLRDVVEGSSSLQVKVVNEVSTKSGSEFGILNGDLF